MSGRARAALVPVAGEEQQERVAAELQGIPAERAGDADERRDDAVERVDELLDAGLAAFGQTLGERRETRDIEEQQARVLLAPRRRVPLLGQPGAMQIADIRCKAIHCHAAHHPPIRASGMPDLGATVRL